MIGKYKNILRTATALVLSLALGACGGGSGSTSTGGVYYTHDQLAAEFVRRVNTDVYGYNLTLVKSTTNKFDYMVVYDNYYKTYDAYYIGQYHVGNNLNNYINSYKYMFYYNLTPQSGNTYWDPVSGLIFEKSQPSSKNLATIKALQQELAIKGAADNLRLQYGMSEEKALDTARFAYKIKTSAPGTYNAKDFNAFTKELTGSTITEFQQDVKSGNISSLNDRINKAAEMTGMGSEGVNKLISDVFNK
ncbi:MAG: hypothetical protein ACXVCY_00080 [Pseudobdellovibrionaceae bacterium]